MWLYSPVELLRFFGNRQIFPFGFYIDLSAFVSDIPSRGASHHVEVMKKCQTDAVPRSAMLNTPVTLELARRCDFLLSFGGELA